MIPRNDVVVIGGGPAGIATALAANQNGFRTVVLDSRVPPLDKPCGEGILPGGVAALATLGVHPAPTDAVPFAGIRFEDEESSAWAEFSGGAGLALRRVRLHELLVARALQAGVDFRWSTSVTHVDPGYVTTDSDRIPYTWLVGADGQNSAVRKWAGLDSGTSWGKRFGFRKHFQVRPWSNMIEVHWAAGCQIYVTPTGEQEVGVAVFSRDPHLRLDQALQRFPALAEKLEGAISTSVEMGDTTCLRRLPEVTQGCIGLVGDASGTVDAITGQGLTLSFQQAIQLAESFKRGNLSTYELAHRKISTIPAAISGLLLLMERSNGLRRKTIRLFQSSPAIFAKLLSIHAGALPLSSIGMSEVADFGWKLLRA